MLGVGDLPAFSAHPLLPPQGGCITKLETFIQEHLRVIGAVGLGIACVQVRAWGREGPGGCGDTGWQAAGAHSCRLHTTGVRHDLHLLPVQEPEAGALLTPPTAGPLGTRAAPLE